MTIDQALKERLSAILPTTPVYPGPRPQSASLPAVEVDVDEDRPSNLDGGDGSTQATAEIRFLATTLREGEQLAAAVRAALPAIGTTWSGLAVDACWCESEADASDWADSGEDRHVWRIEATYQIQY